jgi:hypothetical protein
MVSTADQTQIRTRSSNGPRRLGPQSKAIDRGAVGWSIDGRSREGRFLRAYERMLAEHVGGRPSRVQAELIRRASRLALHLEIQDDLSLQTGQMSDHAGRQYLAWHGALARTLTLLGMESAAPRHATLQEYLSRRAADGQPAASDVPARHSSAPAPTLGLLPSTEAA